jgi:hypothetical protein
MSGIVYQASVYSRVVEYRNFKGQDKKVELFFALDPLQLLSVIASFEPKRNKRSKNPAKQGEVEPITNEQQLEFVQGLVKKAAGWPSDDGESWEPFPEFEESLAGKAFLTKLASSDADRKEFSEKVVLDPFRAYVAYAKDDPSNAPKDVKQLESMSAQLETLFSEKVDPDESLEARRERLMAELAQIEGGPAEGTQGDNGPTV